MTLLPVPRFEFCYYNTINKTMKVIFVSYCLFLLGLGCCVSGYRGSVPRGGSYSLPSIGRYPAPTPTFPGRDHGLSPVYHGKFKRSIDEKLVHEDGGVPAAEEPAEYQKFKRSVDEEEALEEGIEHSRFRRGSNVRIIYPTYRTPIQPRTPQKPILI